MASPASSPRTANSSGPIPDLSPLWSSVGRTHGWESCRVDGDLPPQLRATVLRTGPGVMERFGRRLLHSFEADGAVSGVRFTGGGQAEGAVRVVQSPGYLAEEAAGKPLYGSIAPWWRRFLNGLQQRGKATGNTSILCWQGRTYALMEGSRPIEIDPTDLGTGDVQDLGGVLGPTFSAHPHRLVAERTTFNFGTQFGPKPAIELYALPDEGAARRVGPVALPWNTMVHDFAVTERYAVFILCPLELSLGRALLAPKDMASLFTWTPQLGAELLVVPWDDVERPVRVPMDARFVFHLANAQSRGGDLLVDFVQYPNADVMTALSGDGTTRIAPPQLQRLVVDPSTGALRSDEVLWDRSCDFPVLPAGRVGGRYSTMWVVTGDDGEAGGIARVEPETGAFDEWSPGPGYSPSEPLFIPHPEATRDDQGWLVSQVLDGWRGESFFGVFDADRPSEGPLARVWMGQPLPLTFHGTTVPS